MSNQFIRASNSVRYAYRRFGDKSATPLIFLSHFRSNLDMWDPILVNKVANEREVILFDNTGVGLTDGQAPSTIAQMAKDGVSFLCALGLNQVDLMGFSIGGYVAQEIASVQPELVRSMILAGTAPRGFGGALERDGTVRARATKRFIGPADLLRLLCGPSQASRERGIAYLRRVGQRPVQADVSVSDATWRAQIAAAEEWCTPDEGGIARLRDLTQPTLVAHGEFDVMVGMSMARLLATFMPNAAIKIYPDAGHGFLFERPDEFSGDMLGFLRDVDDRLARKSVSVPCPVRDNIIVLDVKGTDQHEENARLRAAGRAVRVELPNGVLAWAIPHHDDLRRVMVDDRIAKGVEHWELMASGQVPDGWPLIGFVASNSVINAHGDAHRRLRGLVDQALTPARVEAMRPRVQELVDSILDRLADLPEGRVVDLRSSFAYPIPTTVISELLGIPKRQRRLLHVLTGLHTRTDNTPAQVNDMEQAISALLHQVIDDRRGSPADDLITALIEANISGEDQLSNDELVGMVLLMFFAGHQSIINVIVNATHALLTHPEQLAAVRRGEHRWSAVVEETMRWNGAVNQFPMRYPLEDIEIGGVIIKKGEAVLSSFGSAGRDPGHHGADAHEFRIGRAQAGHLGFGHGPHFCVGVHLARLQLEIALSSLFARFPEISPASAGTNNWKLTPVPSFVSNSVAHLPVVLGQPRS
jgi:cytochrome P450/pimeloyl-ACP methyl ester carboxylesterase